MEADIYLGQFIKPSYNPGYIILSYFVSFAGCWTALELLHRRTSARGMYNWFLLLGAATAMGAVAIWCMHYIGNRAIQMLDGDEDHQIQYSPAYTAGSFILPIGIEGFAFYCFGQTDHVSIHGTMLGGLTTGLGICGMHYTGEVGISNYAISYSWKYMVGAAVIAVVANTTALGLSFYFTSTWTNGVWKRVGCALVLALSVSGMHWVASRGTYYRYVANSGRNGLSREGVAIIVLFLGVGCCITLLFLAVIGSRLKKQYADRARQVVLASATFDPEGKLLVTPGGLLPCRKITNTYIEHSFEEVFDTSHPAFCWVFRASHCWQDVKRLIPGIRAHLQATSAVKTSRPESNSSFSDMRSLTIADSSDDYSSIFKELFCVAADDLATLIQQPLVNMGVLFEGIMNTGTVRKAARRYNFSNFTNRNNLDDSLEDLIEAAEKGRTNIIFGRGQLLFLTRRISTTDAIPMKNSGYRFASIANVLETLARSMQVTKKELLPFLENLQKHAGNERIIEPGVHVACFALRPLLQRGFGVAVRKDARNLLPAYPLALSRLERSHTIILNHMDNWTVDMCCDWLREKSLLPSAKKQKFYGQLLGSISKLAKQVEKPFFYEARLVARPFKAPCRVPSTSHSLDYAFVIAFRIMVDAHQPTTINGSFTFAPSRFFLCQQHVYKNSPDHAAFAGRMHRELAALAQNIPGKDKFSIDSRPGKSFESLAFESLPHGHLDASQSTKNKNSFSEGPSVSISLCQGECIDMREPVITNRISTFGGIHVSNEIRIDVSDPDGEDNIVSTGLASLGGYTEASVAVSEPDTFADQLMALTTNERRHTRSESESRQD